MKAKIFHFILDHRVGGPHVYVKNLSEALRLHVESLIVTTGRGTLTDIALINLRHYLRLLYPLEVVLNVLLICRRFRRKQSRQDVVFDVHGAANLAPIIAARMLDVPLVWHFHETIDGFSALVKLGKTISAGTRHRYVVVAAKAAEVFGLTGAQLISGAVDARFWASASIEARSKGSPQRLQLLAVGNLNPLKGMDILLAALEQISHPCELIIVGAELQTYSAYAENLRDHATRLEHQGHSVQFAGWQSPEEVRRLLTRADAFILPSRSEACPLALLEAMAAGCACIAADVGDIRGIIGDIGAGIVVRPDSPGALKTALEQASALGLSSRREMGRKAQKIVQERYSLQEQAVKHLNIYKELVVARKEKN